VFVRTAAVGGILMLAGVVALVTGTIPVSTSAVLFERVWPILVFVVAITVATELAAEAGVFRFVAETIATLGERKRRRVVAAGRRVRDSQHGVLLT
jgi:arsenical pump membrane protein